MFLICSWRSHIQLQMNGKAQDTTLPMKYVYRYDYQIVHSKKHFMK